MKKILLISFLLISGYANAQVSKAIPSKPPRSEGLVHDFTKEGFITRQQEEFLEQKLQAYDDSTSNQIAIVIVEDLKGYDANQFATEIGDSWGVGGTARFDNGIVILISTGGGEGNRDAYIAVGRGLEGAIPDMTAGYIVDHELIPNFKNEDYYRGLDESVNAIIKAAAGEYKAPKAYGKSKGINSGRIILIVILVIILLSVFGNNRGGGYASRKGYRGWWGPFTWGGGWSGGGGSGWSGGGSGGGFGGFGGGSFGGGGAGGKW
ncbi:MAG: TPM domain-containing protein [Bacteroidetes bacterium]|nr:TPM domain-containing protein [Bacteroidota bacterium]